MEKENDEDEDEKSSSAKKTINISYEPENYKKNRSKALNSLRAMLVKQDQREPVNEEDGGAVGGIDIDVDDDYAGAPNEEERKKRLLQQIANSLGTEGNIAGINPFETEASKQPSKFKKMFLKMLKKNQYKKED